MTLLRLNRLHYPVTTLGPGVRAGIWVQGCPIGCRGCMATDTWEAGPQHEIAIVEVLNWLATLGSFDGVTISGGEPFKQPVAVGELIDGIRRARPDADILAYSGYPFRVLERRPMTRALLDRCDAVITGPYVARLNPGARWRGSSNQRLVVLSDRGRQRFPDREAGPADTPGPNLQATFDGTQLRIVGVPRRGELERLEAELASVGISMDGVSWRG
jgi:anaerobic ribonucleoside-triphosphate reductase activating protein